MDADDADMEIALVLALQVFFLSAAAVILLTPRKHRYWVREWITQRDKYGSYNNLIPRLLQSDVSSYRNYFRMDEACFKELVERVRCKIARQDTPMRKAITVEERLAVTLRFLATGDTYRSLEFLTWLPRKTIAKIVPETCDAIFEVLKDEFMQIPKVAGQWKDISEEFDTNWNLPHCLGAVDGKHVKIIAPANSGSHYFNYKKGFSIVLLAVADANYNITYIDVGTNGRISDGGVFSKCSLKKVIERGELHIPMPDSLPGQHRRTSFFFVADDAFALNSYMQKPISGLRLTDAQKVHNYRISRGRRIIENVFGILANRFRVFHTVMLITPNNAVKVVKAACMLHNFLNSRNKDHYMPNGSVDFETETGDIIPGAWRNEREPMGWDHFRRDRRISVPGLSVRRNLMAYFMSDVGKVTWQNKCLV